MSLQNNYIFHVPSSAARAPLSWVHSLRQTADHIFHFLFNRQEQRNGNKAWITIFIHQYTRKHGNGRKQVMCTSNNKLICCLLTTVAALVLLFEEVSCQDAQVTAGHHSCPCLDFGDDNLIVDEDPTLLQTTFENQIGSHINISSYGIGCASHDQDAIDCLDANQCASIVPLPPDCDKSYCSRSWCFVDGVTCPLMNTPSSIFKGRYYSFATCGELDRFTYTDRLRSLKGKTFKVGYTSNSGGWKGAFNPSGSFAIDSKWNGPIVEFIRQAALIGGFTINMTTPPAWIQPMSEEFFGGNSNFDSCVYATALGYLDFCVGGYTITEKRSSVTTFFETTSDPFFLIVFEENEANNNNWETFVQSTFTIFQPFTAASWAMIFLFALPVLGFLMLFHEYGAPGSSYPVSEPVLIIDRQRTANAANEDGRTQQQPEVVMRPISFLNHATNSLYTGILSFFQGSYDLSVVTPGGKVNLLAIASFIMLILAVYTANLAAILTQNARKTDVDSLDAAIRAGYTFCAERKLAYAIIDAYGVDPSRFVPDPIDIGGDGKPGFNCPKCNARERILEQMRRSHDDPSMYCHAAIAKIEDLQIMHNYGKHCDKTKVGDSLGQRIIGIPIFDGSSQSLSALFHKMKSDGVMNTALISATPENQCPVPDEEGSALSPQQLTGVWILTFGFAVLALIIKFVNRRIARGGSGANKRLACRSRRRDPYYDEKGLRRYDQWLNPPGYEVIVSGYRYDSETNELNAAGAEHPQQDDDLQLQTSDESEDKFEACRSIPSNDFDNKSTEPSRGCAIQ